MIGDAEAVADEADHGLGEAAADRQARSMPARRKGSAVIAP